MFSRLDYEMMMESGNGIAFLVIVCKEEMAPVDVNN